MSLSPHQRGNVSNIGKQGVEAVEEGAQHTGEVFYNVGAPSLEQAQSGAGGRVDPSHNLQGSAVFKPEKAYQVWGHFQQSGTVKWVHQEPMQTPAWFQGIPNASKLSQSFGGMDEARPHQALHKTNHDMDALQQEKMAVGSSVPFSEPSQVLAPGMEWNHHTMAAMHHAQFLQQGHKPGDPQYQSHGMRHAMPDSTLQPFQLAFGPTKQPQASGFFPGFHGNSTSQNLGYGEQQKSQQQLLQLQQQQQQQLQHQHQMQQLQQMHQLQQQQQQQRLHQMQQQYHHQQKLQQMQQQQQLQQQMKSIQQPESFASQAQDQRPARPQPLDDSQLQVDSSALSHQRQPPSIQPQTQDPSPQSPAEKDSGPAKASQEPQEPQAKPEVLPRRSRRLSKDGLSPVSSQPPKEPARNGGMGGQGPSGGVIQSTQRRRRASKEINLETLAQKASEMEFLPAKRDEGSSGRQAGMAPLVIPVSVPVRRNQGQTEQAGVWGQEQRPSSESVQQQYDRKPSVIVARRRSLRNSVSDSLNQDEATEDGKSDKIKRRPRPEPLVIPPPKPCTFIAPSIYPSITAYQSHLRSPVRSLDHPLTLPPYTPPPILSPVREGTGLYFSTFLSSIAANTQGLPPPPTPKTASRSLLRSTSSDITPPVLPLIGEATPVSLEPRINIGSHYQAEIPELQDSSLALQDQHKATLVWVPFPEAECTPSQKERVDNLVNMACSSVLFGGGANVELVHHCLYENKGDIMKTLEMLLMKNPVFSTNHHLANYHYAGSDCWTVDEKHYFNKGITAYRKDFFLVQKLVRSKTVAQCVEFYYTYKKQVRVGRNGSITYGPPDPEQSTSEITPKQEHVEEAEDKKQTVQTKENAGGGNLKALSQTFHFKDDVDKVLVLSLPKISSVDAFTALRRETRTPPSAPKPRPESTAKRGQSSAAPKSQGEPEGVFPCKKCSRVFYKVKSRSAHMKSHAEQEKKAAAAAQRQREEEEQAAAKARQEAAGAGRLRAEPGEEEEGDDSSESEDERDKDWA